VPANIHAFLDTNAVFSPSPNELIPANTRTLATHAVPREDVTLKLYIGNTSVREREFQIEVMVRRAFRDMRTLRALAPATAWPSVDDVVLEATRRFRELLGELGIEIVELDLDEVPWEAIVESAVTRRAPFEEADESADAKPREKGFRDALMLSSFTQLRERFQRDDDVVLSIVTSDKRCGEAVELLDDDRVRLFTAVDSLQSFVNETIASLSDAEVQRLQRALATLLHAEPKMTSTHLQHIKAKVERDFAELLAEVDNGYTERQTESFGWGDAVFVSRDQLSITWSMTVHHTSGLLQETYPNLLTLNTWNWLALPTSERAARLVGPDGRPLQAEAPYRFPSLYRTETFRAVFRTTATPELDRLSGFEVVSVDHLDTERTPPKSLSMSYS
jgi:hypothetical protein